MISADIFTKRTGSGGSFDADGDMTLEGTIYTLEMRVNDNMVFVDNGKIVVLRNIISRINNAVYFPLVDIAETGYSVTSAEDSITLTNPFQTKRLIVKSAREIKTQGAIAVADGYDDLHILQYATEKQAADACQYYKSLVYVVWAEPDLIFTTQDLEEGSVTTNAVPSGYLSWGAANMDVQAYADYLSGVVGQSNLREVVVAVLAGIDSSHELFAGRIAEGGRNFSSQAGTAFQDVAGHGTHVSGIIVNLNYANVKVLPIKVMNDKGEGTSATIIQGINYVISLKDQGVNIYAMNMSFGGKGSSSVYASTINNATAKGLVSVVAAGNDDEDTAGFTPANVPAVITVAASDSNNNRAYFSNWGTTVDIAAPGVNINSAKVGGGYVNFVDKGNVVGGLPIPYERADYTFAGWFTSRSGGTLITEATSITVTVTFYAHWTENPQCLVSFNYNGGSGSSSSRLVDKNTAVGALPTPAVRNGYIFAGWFTAMSGGTQVTNATIITTAVTFYAHWTALPYTVTFDSNGGSAVPPITADCGTTVRAPISPEKQGFIFGGWYTDNGTFNSPYVFTTMPFNGITLYARWLGIFRVTRPPATVTQ